jgi:hypothetical protein
MNAAIAEPSAFMGNRLHPLPKALSHALIAYSFRRTFDNAGRAKRPFDVVPEWNRPVYESSKRRMTWCNCDFVQQRRAGQASQANS